MMISTATMRTNTPTKLSSISSNNLLSPRSSSSPSSSSSDTLDKKKEELYPITNFHFFSIFFLCLLSLIVCSLWWGRVSNLEEPTSTAASVAITGPLRTPKTTTTQSPSYYLDKETLVESFVAERTSKQQQQQQKKRQSPTFILTNDMIKDDNIIEDKNSNSANAFMLSSSKSVSKDTGTSIDNSQLKLVLLMSFPNSGTSYTMTMVQRASHYSVATNYGREIPSANEPNGRSYAVPLPPYHVDHTTHKEYPLGPFYNPEKPLPPHYILTKTHCGLRCVDCPPLDYFVTQSSDFWPDTCTYGNAKGIKNDTTSSGFVEYPHLYDMTTHVAKAIHLIRNPFHNIIARFHLERKHRISKSQDPENKNKKEYVLYDNSPQGFQQYCHDLNTHYEPELLQLLSPGNHNNTSGFDGLKFFDKYLKETPCHGEFYRYTKWHNYVMRGLQFQSIPTMMIFYEDYETSNTTTTKSQQEQVLDYLELEAKEPFKEFASKDHTYKDYYTPEQYKAIHQLIKRIAIPSLYNVLNDDQHYFDF